MKAGGAALVISFALGLAPTAVPPAIAAESAPKIEGASASNVLPHDATLEASIDPGGLETSYTFYMLVNSNWGGEIPEYFEPLAAGQLPASYETQHVTLDLNSVGVGLTEDETYVFAVGATSAAGTAWEEFLVVTPAPLPPKIENEAVSNVGRGDATLEAWINPGGLETSYEFIFAERLWCENTTPACEPPIEFISLPGGKLPASYETQHVTLDLNSVGVFAGAPNFYDFVTKATNAAGTGWGPGEEFYPPPFVPEEEPEPPVEPPEEEPGSFEEPPPEEQGSSEEKPEVAEPPIHDGPTDIPQGEEAGPPPPPPAAGAIQDPPKASRCHRAPRRHHHKHHRHHRTGVGKACHPA